MDQPRGSWQKLLFPESPRKVWSERWWRTVIRTVHIASMAVLVGGHFFAMPPERLVGPLLWTVDSGITIMLLEMYGSMHWLLEVRGLLTVVKLVLVLLVPVFWSQRIWILLSIIVIGFVGSHMPGRLRYYCPFDGTVGHTRNG